MCYYRVKLIVLKTANAIVSGYDNFEIQPKIKGLYKGKMWKFERRRRRIEEGVHRDSSLVGCTPVKTDFI